MAVTVTVPFSFTVTSLSLNVIPVGLIILGFSFTVTLNVAVFPLVVLAVIVAVPTETPVIFPPDTAATFVFEEVHATVFVVAFSGKTVAVTFSDSPSRTVTEDLLNVTL